VIDRYLKKRIGITPSPGTYRTCFAYIEDIVNGHLLAMENGRAGEKYILGGINISYLEFFNAIHKVSSIKGHIMQLSKNTIKGWALLQMINYAITGRPPFFTAGAIDHFFGNYCFSSEKAIDQIGYKITPLEVALEKTIHYLNQPQHVT
jgi:dihydroflavonol-4-reductase/farnesol dehydrogenase